MRCQNMSNVSFRVLSSTSAHLRIEDLAHNLEEHLSFMVRDWRVVSGRFYSFINEISFHGSRRFIFTGSCSATHGLLLS